MRPWTKGRDPIDELRQNLAAPLRVLMVTERYLPLWGGAERQLRELSARLADRGCDVRIVTRRWHADFLAHEDVGGIPVDRIGIPGEGIASSSIFVAELVRYLSPARSRYDIIHGHGAAKLGALLAGIGAVGGPPCVVKIATAGRIPMLSSSLRGRALLSLLRRADRVVALSEEIARELEDARVPSRRVAAISNGVDGRVFAPAPAQERMRWRASYGLPEESLVVVFSGRLVERKGLDTLIEAWTLCERRLPDREAHLVLLGSGSDQPDSVEPVIRALVGERRLQRVHFAGSVSAPEVILNAADLFAFPSRLEGFPNALLEAMSAGLAPVASRIGGNTDMVHDGTNGVLFDVDDAQGLAAGIVGLIEDAPRRARLAARAREDALQRFGIDAVADRYLRTYEDILLESNRSAERRINDPR